MLEARGVSAELLGGEGGPPVVFGDLVLPGAERTIVFYAHYDGQPVDETRWATRPFEPTLRSGSLEDGGTVLPRDALDGPLDPESRVYARSASDDKSPIVAMLTALDALKAAGVAPSVNVKFFFEGEEEAGSPHLGAVLRRHAERLAADVWLFCDGPVHQSRQPQVVFGAR